MTTPVVDAHHHFWRYSPESHGWIDPQSMAAIARDFGPTDLAAEAAARGVDAVVSVQAEQTTDETRWLLEIAEGSPLIAGVVGWAPLASKGCAAQLGSLAHPTPSNPAATPPSRRLAPTACCLAPTAMSACLR